MHLAYPIQAILFYLSILFAPADAGRILIQGPDRSAVLVRDAGGWCQTGPEGEVRLHIDGSRLISESGGKSESLDLADSIGTAAGHDWSANPKLALPDGPDSEATVVERDATAFTVRIDRGREGIYPYSIAYISGGVEPAATCSVLGAVKQPGIVALADGATLRSVLIQCGLTPGKDTPQIVWRFHGEPDEPLLEREGIYLTALLEGRGSNPKVRDRDTLYVEPTVLLELGREGSLAVDGSPCPGDELEARLRDRVAAGARSATLFAHRSTPRETIQPLFNACVAAGIPADRLKLDTEEAHD